MRVTPGSSILLFTAVRYAELENIAEDAAEAARRGNVLLHSQQVTRGASMFVCVIVEPF